MKATAHKIKDNEWIVEVEGEFDKSIMDRRVYRHPIVSPSDKEWLEKNNMDGKEVEGDVTHPTFANGRLKELKQVFMLTTPPIHSDPAWEEDKLVTIKCTNCGKDAFERKSHLDDKRTALCGKCKRDNLLNLISPGSAPTPQTGRTYTQKDVDEAYDKGYRDGVIYRVANH